MAKDELLEGRVAVVTGAARGLGRAIAARLEQSGARIVAVDLSHALENVPEHWETAAIDLSEEAANLALNDLANRLGSVDIVVANAGLVPPWRGLNELNLAEWDRVMRVNTWGVASTIGAFADALERSGRGSIVAMSSINGYSAAPKQALYTASKHAVIGIMRAAALELGPRGIRANALAPGPIATEALLDRLNSRHAKGGPAPVAALQSLSEGNALGRLATPQDVANAAHFLASDASAGMTGVVMPVEAGFA